MLLRSSLLGAAVRRTATARSSPVRVLSSLSRPLSAAAPAAAASAPHAPGCAAPGSAGDRSSFLGASSRFSSDLKLHVPGEPMECFRVMDAAATFRLPEYTMTHSPEKLREMYACMVRLNEMDKIFYDAQRQGRISFYMTSYDTRHDTGSGTRTHTPRALCVACAHPFVLAAPSRVLRYGEEATHVGSASALVPEDVVFGQYREAGVLMWRGFTLDQFAHQCFSSTHDVGKGRQMPVHYGSRKLNFQTISSPLGTQLPQAAGAAYALKREGKKNVVICYFGQEQAGTGAQGAERNIRWRCTVLTVLTVLTSTCCPSVLQVRVPPPRVTSTLLSTWLPLSLVPLFSSVATMAMRSPLLLLNNTEGMELLREDWRMGSPPFEWMGMIYSQFMMRRHWRERRRWRRTHRCSSRQ